MPPDRVPHGPITVHTTWEGDSAMLAQFVKLKAVEVHDEQGRRVDYMIREGRR
jgi:hypothetical protein